MYKCMIIGYDVYITTDQFCTHIDLLSHFAGSNTKQGMYWIGSECISIGIYLSDTDFIYVYLILNLVKYFFLIFAKILVIPLMDL